MQLLLPRALSALAQTDDGLARSHTLSSAMPTKLFCTEDAPASASASFAAAHLFMSYIS